ncbi:MAG: MmcQ/YjbR family DNA-binding protein [Cyclobacteriaceae bacterium]
MINIETFRQLALAFPKAIELPHFEKTSFRVNKKIFATLNTSNQRAVVKLSPIDQSVFCEYDNEIIYPVKGAWGKQGWTAIELKKVKRDLLSDLLNTSYTLVSAPKSTKKKKQ